MASPALNSACPELRAERTSSRAQRAHDSIRTDRLGGNVGLLMLADVPSCADAATLLGAMRLLVDSDALLVDLRHCRDLSPSLAALIASWLFDTALALAGETYVGPGMVPRPESLDAPPRYLDRPVLLVLGPESGRVAAELARNLKRLRRAIVVGESPRQTFLSPNVPAPAARAPKLAHLVALTTLQMQRASTDSPLTLQSAIVGVRRELEQLRASGYRDRAAS